MKLPWTRRRRSATTPAPAPDPDTSSIDITIERECFYQAFEGHPGPCPRCGGPLRQSYHSYVMGTRRGSQITDSFLMGSDFGWFCPGCPTVVIDPAQVKRRLEHPLPHWDTGTDFAILGLVNLDAVPPEKADVPLGDEDNAIPLIRFIAPRRQRGPAQPGAPHRPASGRKKPKSKKRRS